MRISRLFPVAFMVVWGLSAAQGGEVSPPEGADTGGIEWYSSYGQAKEEVLRDHSLVVVLFTRAGCPWCDKLEAETFADPRVVVALKEFKNVHLKPENPEYVVLARKFRLRGVPYVGFIDEDGGMLLQVSGYVPPDDFLKRIEGAKKARREHLDKVAAFEKEPDNPKAAVAVLESLVSREQLREATEMRAKVLSVVEKSKDLKADEKNGLRAQVKFIDALLEMNLKNDAERVDRTLALLKEVEALASEADKELASQALWYAAFLNFQYDRLKNAEADAAPNPARVEKTLALLEEIVRKYPDTKWAKQAQGTIPGLKAGLERLKAGSGK